MKWRTARMGSRVDLEDKEALRRDIVALMLEHGVRTIWTRDRDYRAFAGIRVKDPFTA